LEIKKAEVSKQGDTENGVTQNFLSANISTSYLFQKSTHLKKFFEIFARRVPFKRTKGEKR